MLGIFGLVTRLLLIWHPKVVVWDEYYFGQFVTGYLSHIYFFDIHPPLAKLLITLVAYLGGFRADSLSFAQVAAVYTNNYYILLRLLPALAGAGLPVLIYFLAREMKFEKMTAFFAGILVVFESSLLVESRFVLTDSLLLLFGFLGLLLYLISRRRGSLSMLAFASLSLASALTTKWTGVAFLGLVVFWECNDFFEDKVEPKLFLKKIGCLIAIPVALYVSTFAVHFALLQKSGPDDGYMSPSFQKTLLGNQFQKDESVTRASFFGKFFELQKEMLFADQKNVTHRYGSKWYTWPLMLRPVLYWGEGSDSRAGRIYLFGNPIIYWLTFLAVCALFIHAVFRTKFYKENREIAIFLLLGFFGHLLPFFFIHRVMYLYHYQSALLFAILILAFFVEKRFPVQKKKIFQLVIGASILSFLFFLPLIYGIPVSTTIFRLFMWFPSWK